MTKRRGGRKQIGDRAVVGMSGSAPAPAALTYYGEGKTMHVATKRSMIAAAAIAAAGLFGSLPYDGATVAQQGVPVVHHEVALVDVTSAAVNDAQQALLDVEGALNTTLSNATVADNGLLDVLYTTLGADLSESLLLTDGDGAIYDADYLNVFNGAATAGFNGFISNTLAFQAQLNDILGVPEVDSQTFLLAQFDALFVGDVPATLGTPEIGDGFVADLVSIANNQYDLAGNDLIDYTQYLFTNFTDVIEGFTQLDLGELVTNLSDGLTSLTTGLTDNVNDLINAIIGLL